MAIVEITAPQLSGAGEVLFGRELWDRQDYNPSMRSGQALATYEKMRSTDGEIAGGLMRLTSPLLSAKWQIEPPKGEDPGTHEPTLLCRRVLMGDTYADPFSDTWSDRLRHALLMLPFGFSAFEKVWGVDRDGRQVYARLAPIMPQTFFKFTFSEDGKLESGTQRAYVVRTGTYETVEIPAAKLAVFTFGREGMNIFGRAILRTAWIHWHYKRSLIEIDGIRHERCGVGVSWVEIPEGDSVSDDQRADVEKVTRQLRTHEQQGVYMPPGWKLHVDYPTGTMSDIVGSLKYHDQQESRSLLTEFMATGTAETGSRSVVSSKIDQMMLALQGTANIVEDVFNRQAIPDLVARNFGEQEEYPQLQCEDLDKMSGTQLAEISKLLADAGLLRADKPLRAHYRETLDLPPEDDATLDDPKTAANPFGAGTAQGGVPDSGSMPAGAKEAEPAAAPKPSAADTPPKTAENGGSIKARASLTFMGSEVVPIGSPVSLSRAPMPHECFCAFTEMKAYMRDEPQRIWHRVVEPYRKRLAARIAAKVPGMPDDKLAARDLGAMPGLRGPFEDDMAAALLKVYMRGRASVLAERQRQLSGTPVSPVPVSFREGEPGDEWDIAPSKEQKAWVATLAVGFVGALVTGMVNEASRAGLAARQAEVSARDQQAQVLAAVDALSVARQQVELSGTVNRTFGTGRTEQADEMRDQIVTEYYSAIMDEGTCAACAALDGMEQKEGDDKFTTPNPECAGDDNCRCVNVYVFRQEREAA
jgi:hypothetical protein